MRTFERLREGLKRCTPLRILVAFQKNVCGGYRLYARLLRPLGANGAILGTAWCGTGDYYLCAGWLGAWLEREQIKEFMFLAPDGPEKEVLALFPRLRGHTAALPGGEKDYFRLLAFRAFLGPERCRFYSLHHAYNFPADVCQNISRGYLQGHNGLTMADFYQYLGFGFDRPMPREAPQFAADDQAIDAIFAAHGLHPGKTALLAPYSSGLAEFAPPMSFWVDIARQLQAEGWTVCTNCAGGQAPVPGTAAVDIPYRQLAPFLDRAGLLIALRSGLCEVASTSACKKVILHTHKAKWWPEGRSIPFTGLGNMGLGHNAIEKENVEDTTKIVAHVKDAPGKGNADDYEKRTVL